MSESFNSFLQNQNNIFDKFRAATAELGKSQGLEKDPGTNPQGAFLIAWRYPEKTTALVEEFSSEIAEALNNEALIYGPDNAHTTVSDHKLLPELVIRPENVEDMEILDILSNSVKRALGKSGKAQVSGCAVEFTDMPTNGKTVIAAGIPTESIWQINQQVLAESAELGIPLKGSWGTHMTVSRFLAGQEANSPAVSKLLHLIETTPEIGTSKPTAIDVGFFHTDAQNGFAFTPFERFDIG